jgi:hypothetical protein
MLLDRANTASLETEGQVSRRLDRLRFLVYRVDREGERLLKAGKVAFDVESKPGQYPFTIIVDACRVLIHPVLIAGLQDKRIMKIASGSSHSLAIDEHGHVYAWGNNGYAKLGLGDQEDRYVFSDLLDGRPALMLEV